MKTTLKKCAGGVLIVGGVALGFVPFIPGIVLIVLGLELLEIREWVLKKIGLPGRGSATSAPNPEVE